LTDGSKFQIKQTRRFILGNLASNADWPASQCPVLGGQLLRGGDQFPYLLKIGATTLGHTVEPSLGKGYDACQYWPILTEKDIVCQWQQPSERFLRFRKSLSI